MSQNPRPINYKTVRLARGSVGQETENQRRDRDHQLPEHGPDSLGATPQAVVHDVQPGCIERRVASRERRSGQHEQRHRYHERAHQQGGQEQGHGGNRTDPGDHDPTIDVALRNQAVGQPTADQYSNQSPGADQDQQQRGHRLR